MGDHATRGFEKIALYSFAFLVWFINALTLSVEGGGFFGTWRGNSTSTGGYIVILISEIAAQVFYAAWNLDCVFARIDTRNGLYTDTPVEAATADLRLPIDLGDDGTEEREII